MSVYKLQPMNPNHSAFQLSYNLLFVLVNDDVCLKALVVLSEHTFYSGMAPVGTLQGQ